MRGGVGVDVAGRLAVAAVVNRTLVSIPDGTGRLTLLTVGTNLSTLVVVAEVTGTAATEIGSNLGIVTGAEHVVTVVSGSTVVDDDVSTLIDGLF